MKLPHIHIKPHLALQLAGAFVFLAIAFGAAQIGAALTSPVTSDPAGWYAGLEKSVLNPPNWVFPVVWTLLYALMAAGAWRAWRVAPNFRAFLPALGLWLGQLAINVAWSWAFFGLQSPLLAACIIALLAVAIALTMRAFRAFDRLAALALAPYLAWVAFAAYLNLTVFYLNGA